MTRVDDSRARFGVIVPSTNTVVEQEFAAFLPRGTASFTTRLLVGDLAPTGGSRHGTARLEEATQELAGLGASVLAYLCTTASAGSGGETDEQLCERMRSAGGGLTAITTSTAISMALRALGPSVVRLVTPYDTAHTEEIREFLEREGLQVTRPRELGLTDNLERGRLPATASYELAAGPPESGEEAIVIACTNWLTLEYLARIERETRLPVITSTSATMWAMLRLAGIDDDLDWAGRLGTLGLSHVPAHVAASSIGV